MNRRQLLKSVGCLTAASYVAPFGLSAKTSHPSLVNIKNAFANALDRHPALLGFEGTNGDFEPQDMKIEGKIPTDLRGAFYRNGPAKQQRQNGRYRHLFEGDGMIQEFAIANGSIRHRGKFVQTPKFSKEDKVDQFLYSGPDSKFSEALPVSSSDVINVANTNVLPVGNDLWALWEAGSASRINGDSLEFEEYIDLGKGNQFGKGLKGLPFSAHPKVDPSGDIWNFGLGPGGFVLLYHLSANGRVKKVKMVDARYPGNMLHDFLITQDYILLILPSLKTKQADGYFERVTFAPEQAMRVLLINKSDFSIKQEYELDAAFAFHFGNAWQHPDGSIHFDASLYPNVDVLHKMSRLMSGDVQHEEVNGHTVFFSLYPNGKTDSRNSGLISEFPRVCPHLTGLQNHQLYFLSSTPEHLWSNRLVAMEPESGRYQQFDYGEGFLAEEHIPICPNKVEGKGYVMGTALHIPSKRTCLNIFKAENIADGPIARAWLPYHLPLGFHGNFKAA